MKLNRTNLEQRLDHLYDVIVVGVGQAVYLQESIYSDFASPV